jgi:cell division transport system permease protein
MLRLRLLAVLLRDAAKDLFRHRGQHLLAVVTLASGLLLAGGGLLLLESLERAVGRLEGFARITVWASEGRSLDELEARLSRDPRFPQVARVPSAEATRRLHETTREAGLMLESLGREAMPEYLELTLSAALTKAGRALEVGESLKALDGVGDVLVDHERLASMQRAASWLRSAFGTLGLLLMVAAGFSTGNVIRMSILSREDEISIMRLVGASEAFIRTPLVIEGGLLGILGSALAVLGLFGFWLGLAKGAGAVSPMLVELARMGFFSLPSLALLFGVGTLTGMAGAWWGFWSTQRVQRDQLAALERLES